MELLCPVELDIHRPRGDASRTNATTSALLHTGADQAGDVWEITEDVGDVRSTKGNIKD